MAEAISNPDATNDEIEEEENSQNDGENSQNGGKKWPKLNKKFNNGFGFQRFQ